VTGELPFKSCSPLDAWMKKIQNEITPPRQLARGLSERVDWAIRRGMSADPLQRPGTAREFIEDLTGQSTRRMPPSPGSNGADVWYLVYRDDEGIAHSVKGSTDCIRRSLREGLLGDASNVRVGRVKAGPFEPLRQHPEFRDMVIEPMAMSGPKVPTPLPVAPLPPIASPTATPRPPTRGSSSDVSSSQFIVPVAPPRPPASPGSVPHIPMSPSMGAEEWVKWLTVLAFALSAGVGGFFVVRWLTAMRLI
jgi:eukaryotic-like serine/threonine-protein kinase